MKKILFALSAVVLSASFVSAATVSAFDVKTSIVKLDDEKVKIKVEELPEAIQTTLKGQDYPGWKISSAYKYSDQEISKFS